VELLKLVDEVALVVGELVSVNKVRLSQGANDRHDICLALKGFDTFLVEAQAVNTLFNTFVFLTAACDTGQEVGYLSIIVLVVISLSFF
jgi:hypothetical protein